MLAVTLLAAWVTLTAVVCWLAPARVLAGPGIELPLSGPRSVSGPASTYRLESETFQHKFVAMRHLAYVRYKRIRQLKRTLLHTSSVTEAINLACVVYGNCSTLWRKARCESGLSPYAHNGSEASGLFQFLPSTWGSTPYGRFSIWSAYANSLAAGWMHAHGRAGEWTCR